MRVSSSGGKMEGETWNIIDPQAARSGHPLYMSEWPREDF
jgi:hypothetical protein